MLPIVSLWTRTRHRGTNICIFHSRLQIKVAAPWISCCFSSSWTASYLYLFASFLYFCQCWSGWAHNEEALALWEALLKAGIYVGCFYLVRFVGWHPSRIRHCRKDKCLYHWATLERRQYCMMSWGSTKLFIMIQLFWLNIIGLSKDNKRKG